MADRAIAAALLVCCAPILIVVSLFIVLDSRGPILFRQQRVGRGYEEFTILKFRSMKHGHSDKRHRELNLRELAGGPGLDGPVAYKDPEDPGITRTGRVLRRYSLDELPQLVNVLKGDMSLIGPRPELVSVAAREGFLVHPRHLERPGITGRFQISELRAQNRISAGLHLDVSYVADVRLRSDAAILFRTVFVLAGRGS